MKVEDSELQDYGDSQLHLRRGKWTVEEENYANKIISFFNQGRLSIVPGTTLRSYLSEKLQCDPMRITKKYAGKSCIGKQVYQPCEGYHEDLELIREAERELQAYERVFLTKIQSKASSIFQSPGNRQHFPSQRQLRSDPTALASYEDKPLSHSNDFNGNQDFPSSFLVGKANSPLRSKGSSRRPNLSRRNLSAPNLTSFDDHSFRRQAPNKGLQVIKEDDVGDRYTSRVTEEFFLLGGRLPVLVGKDGSVESSTHSSNSSFSVKKRSHSVMALMDFEKLVSDEKAAGDLFYEFVTTIGEATTGKRRNKSSASSNNSPGDEVATVLLDGLSATNRRLNRGDEGEESSFNSGETEVQRFKANEEISRVITNRLVSDEGVMLDNDGLMVVQQVSESLAISSMPLVEEDEMEDQDNFF